mmetsp:Transcript_44723/g.70011  ORF Transcript_44723/g.70011 Transcript_44723/m.70011 type:complete len:112 (+) Transcript_44723:689-1024(+)
MNPSDGGRHRALEVLASPPSEENRWGGRAGSLPFAAPAAVAVQRASPALVRPKGAAGAVAAVVAVAAVTVAERQQFAAAPLAARLKERHPREHGGGDAAGRKEEGLAQQPH